MIKISSQIDTLAPFLRLPDYRRGSSLLGGRCYESNARTRGLGTGTVLRGLGRTSHRQLPREICHLFSRVPVACRTSAEPRPGGCVSWRLFQGCHELAYPLKRKCEVPLRVGVRESEMVFADLPEGAAGENGDPRFVEQLPGEFVGVDREFADIREGIEGAARASARDSGQRVETVDDEFAAAGEFGHHRLRLVDRPAQGSDAGVLDEGRNAGGRVGEETDERVDQRLRDGREATTPARHRERLRQPVEKNLLRGLPGDVRDRSGAIPRADPSQRARGWEASPLVIAATHHALTTSEQSGLKISDSTETTY
jgi:hypothetical protein